MKNKIVYKNKWFSIKKFENYFVFDENQDQVVILPIINSKKIILVKQYRVPLMKFTLEFPAGGFNKNSEKPKIAAIRELFEETGINISQTKRLKQLKRMSVNPQRHSKIPFAYYVNITESEYKIRSKKISKEIKAVISLHFNKFIDFYQKGLIISSIMGNIFFNYLLLKKKIILKNINTNEKK